ncbi:CaiB/BaiF CoA transferase family protein [Aquabacter cavernae]|uniref:CaiB/BaiF CoA transferase family protein n=1 Tax=Aquabacter cavernae TaxID=2496029 RepID=UPI00196B1D11|nr:CaiB/BaiF CoA-transferase family protein [Aquabacter cavernae]
MERLDAGKAAVMDTAEHGHAAASRPQARWPGPLSGLRVLDLTRVLAGPLATQFLCDLGAEVLKIEPPGRGDETRGFAPFVGGESHYFLSLNRGKKSLVVDLATPEGAQILKDLCATADVVIENFRPGVMERFGLGADVLMKANPRLIYCAISGFGLTGPLRDMPSFDIVAQAMTGVMSINGEPGRAPQKLGLPVGDMSGGFFGAIAILSALVERAQTGRGRLIDVSLYDGTMSMLGYFAQLAFVNGEDPAPAGSAHATVVPYGSFAASDGAIIIACLADRFWPKLCDALDMPAMGRDPLYATMADRRARRDEIEPRIAEAIARESVAHWRAVLDAHDVPHAPLLGVTAALGHPQARAREMVVDVEHPTAGRLRLLGRPIKFPGSPQAPLEAPPRLGEHTAEVLKRELGLTDAQVAGLTERGLINRTG